MALTMRPTGLGHGVYKNDIDYSVFCGEWCIGRIYENRSGPEDQRWFWALHPQAGRKIYELPTKWPRWKRPRQSSRRAGNDGRRGGRWKRCLEDLPN